MIFVTGTYIYFTHVDWKWALRARAANCSEDECQFFNVDAD